jgi:hypothetical protein
MWCFTPVIPALRRWRQKYSEFQASLGYIVRPCQNKKRKKRKEGEGGREAGRKAGK